MMLFARTASALAQRTQQHAEIYPIAVRHQKYVVAKPAQTFKQTSNIVEAAMMLAIPVKHAWLESAVLKPVHRMGTARSRITNAREPTATMENASLEISRMVHHAMTEIHAQIITVSTDRALQIIWMAQLAMMEMHALRTMSAQQEYARQASSSPVLKEMNAAMMLAFLRVLVTSKYAIRRVPAERSALAVSASVQQA